MKEWVKNIGKHQEKLVNWNEKGWIYIRYFWKRVQRLMSEIPQDVYSECIKTADYLEKAMDEGNEVAKRYFKGEIGEKELKQALEKCYQAWLKLYNQCILKQKIKVKNGEKV